MALVLMLDALISVRLLFLLVSGIGCGLLMWHSLDFLINFMYGLVGQDYRSFSRMLCLVTDFVSSILSSIGITSFEPRDDKTRFAVCEKQRHRSACASAHQCKKDGHKPCGS